MPQRVSARGRKGSNARISPERGHEEKLPSHAPLEIDEIQDLSLKLDSESIQGAKVGDAEFEMLMLDGYGNFVLIPSF
jgi:hypothetical protein